MLSIRNTNMFFLKITIANTNLLHTYYLLGTFLYYHEASQSPCERRAQVHKEIHTHLEEKRWVFMKYYHSLPLKTPPTELCCIFSTTGRNVLVLA